MKNADANLKRLVWLYFWLLIFEGALRKWILPGLSTPLLLVRDPVVIAIYALALARGIMPAGPLVVATVVLAVVTATTAVAGIGGLFVTLFGVRANYLHLPLILLLPRIFDAGDVRKMLKALMLLSPFMALLAIQQFRGGPESYWNVGAGGVSGGQIEVTAEKVRASGTFSFVNGIGAYLALLASAVLCGFIEVRKYPRWIVWVSLGSLLLTLAVSGSRSAVLGVTVVCATLCYMAIRKPNRFGALVRVAIVGNLLFVGLAHYSSSFNEGVSVHGERFESGGGLKEGIFMRFLLEFPAAFDTALQSPLLGYGLGVGTNAAAGLLSGYRGFLLAESEWSRVMAELGWLFGAMYLLLRIGYTATIWRACERALAGGISTPMLLFGAGSLMVLVGQFGQPTALGFAVLVGGLAVAACREPGLDSGDAPPAPREEGPPLGRSAYASRLRQSQPGNDARREDPFL